jgi:energy-converting hydrogenase Eha subunit A
MVLSEQWNESAIVPMPHIRRAIQVIVLITKACNLSTVCKMLSDILLSSLTLYVYEIFGDYHCEI